MTKPEERTKDETEQATRRRDLAHELRTPIGSAMTRLEMLRDGTPGFVLDAATREIAHDARRALEHALEVLDRLLMPPPDHSDLRHRRQDVVSVIADAIAIVKPAAAAREVGLSCAGLDQAIAIHGDPGTGRQILVNILINAIKYSPPGAEVHLTVTKGADRVNVIVADHGLGMTATELATLRARLVPTAEVDGAPHAGAGLRIAARLARAMAATLNIESVPGAGTTVALSLPLTP